MKAKALGMPAEDYLTDKTPEESDFVKRKILRARVSDRVVAQFYEKPEGVSPKELKLKPAYNEYFELVGESSRLPVMYNGLTKNVVRVEQLNVSGISPRNDEQACALDALMRPQIQLVALTGVAGTGKTLLALAAALAQLDDFKSVLLSRPVIPLQNQDMGFLPGDANEKLARSGTPNSRPAWSTRASSRTGSKATEKPCLGKKKRMWSCDRTFFS